LEFTWEEDLYELIGVDSESTIEEIKKAYKKKAVELHPDRFPDDEAKRLEATALFGKITNAYNVLKDEEERAEYDFARRMGFGNGGGAPAPKAGGAKPAAGGGASSAAAGEDPGVSDHKRSQAQNQFDQGKVYHKGKNYMKAIACYKEATRMDPSVADYHAHLGLAYLQNGLKTPANKAFEAAYKLDKKHKILTEHYEPAMSSKTKAKHAPKQGLLAQLMAMFGGGASDKKGAKGKKGGGKRAGAKR
jgi:curved DNA-binding protein CbpA